MWKSRPRAFATEMPRPVVSAGAALALLLAIAAWRIQSSSAPGDLPLESKTRPPEAAPLCPWREPQNDLKQFFPEATRYETETRILSGHRLELADRLGRTPAGDENALRIYPIFHEQTPLGVVMTRRAKGDFGAIELVVAVGPNQQVRGVRLQRLREPPTIAGALQNSNWLSAFEGKGAGASWKLGQDIPEVPAEAHGSAQAVVDGVRSLLILLATSEETLTKAHH